MMQSAHARARWRFLLPLGIALFAAAVILFAVYPGFMSYDSVVALHEARNGVQGGNYPPFASYVWRVFDAVWPGPALMLFAQNFLLVLSFAAILRTLGHRDAFIVVGVAALCFAPPILGPMLVVWKDVAVSACLCAAVCCFLVSEQASNPRLAIVAGIFMLFCGAAYRLNAIAAVLPISFWFAWRRGSAGIGRGKSLVASLAIFVGIALAVTIVDRYRFPELTPLAPNHLIETLVIYDLAGMSAVAGTNLMPATTDTPPATDTVAYLRKIYDPRSVNIVAANDSESRLKHYFDLPPPDMRAAFFGAVRREPRAYVEHRNAVFRELIGLAEGSTVMATHPAVDENAEGVTHRPGPLTARALDYIRDESHSLDGKPWLYYLLGTIALALAIVRGRKVPRSVAVAVYASAALYLLSFYFTTPAADLRYNHWSIVCMFIVTAVALAPSRDDPARVELPA
jgi:hypothetical protein